MIAIHVRLGLAAVVATAGMGCQSLLGIESTTEVAASGDGGPGADAMVSGFALSVEGNSVRMNRDGNRIITVNATREEGFGDAIDVVLVDPPAGITSDGGTIAAGESSVQFAVAAADTAALGPDSLDVQGTAGDVVRTATVPLMIGDPPGTLDQTFGTAGVFTLELGGDVANGARAMVIRGDGAIVVGGDGWHIVQLTPDGALDTSFGTGGIVTGAAASDIADMELDSAGQLVVGGTEFVDPMIEVVFRRYGATGTPDTAFGTDGRLLALSGGVLNGTAIDGLDNVLFVTSNMVATFVVKRITAAGQLDGGFTYSPPFMSSLNALATRSDLSVVGAGSLDGLLVTSADSSGSPQASFAGDGTATVDPGINDSCNAGSAILLRPDDSVIVAGQCVSGGGQNEAHVASLLADGTQDPNFGDMFQTGITGANMGGNRSQVLDMALQPDGAFIMVGVGNLSGTGMFDKTVANVDRAFGTGSDDSTFSLVQFGDRQTESFRLEAVALQADGRIVVAGHQATRGYFVARIWN